MEAKILNQSEMRRPQVFGTGLVALDLVISADPSVPIRAWAGGTCGNVLLILAALGWEVFPVARLNGDPASKRILADMKTWGVRLDFTRCGPATSAPIIIQQIIRTRDGAPRHRFSWACPHCGNWLPSFKPVTTHAVEMVAEYMGRANAFFMDRLSRAALSLAKRAADSGAVVIFEPSAKSDERLLREAIAIAHIIKYSDERFAQVLGAMERGSATLLEVHTLGAGGLRYRHRLGRSASSWKQLAAEPVAHVADTCGSGDWCTAGLISRVAGNGLESLTAIGAEGAADALRFGQKLAAWNVGFEGARGGMYVGDRESVERNLRAFGTGAAQLTQLRVSRQRLTPASVVCPACPPTRGRSHAQKLQVAQSA